MFYVFFFFQAEDGIRDLTVTGVQTCALPIYHGVGCVVDDHVHTGGGFERPDVAALAPDDAALHLVGGQRDRRDGALRGVLGGETLDREGEDLLRPFVGVPLRLLLQVTGAGRGLAARLVLEPAQQLLLRLLREIGRA